MNVIYFLSFFFAFWFPQSLFGIFATNEPNKTLVTGQQARVRRSAWKQEFGPADDLWNVVIYELNGMRQAIGLSSLTWQKSTANSISLKDFRKNSFFSVPISRPGKNPSQDLITAIRLIFHELLHKNLRCKRGKCYAKTAGYIGLPVGSPPGFPGLKTFFQKADVWQQIAGLANGEWIKGREGEVTVEMMNSLADGNWLTSEVIDAYLAMLISSKDSVKAISTIDFMRYDKTRTYDIAWKLNKVHKILVPAHINGNHWAMIVADVRKKKLAMLDSLNHGVKSAAAKTKLLHTTRNLMRDISGHRSWTLTEKMNVPQQTNGTDCGVFALVFGIYTVRKEHIYNFSQKNIPYFRRKIASDLLDKKIS